jgi:hypothetical protein
MSNLLLGYQTEDIMKVLQRAYDETGENRDRALKLYDHMENAMLNNKGDLVILSQMADRYLEQATRQTELLVRLVGVMQKLKQFSGGKGEGLMTDVNQLLELLDNNKITPFTIGAKKKTASDKQPDEKPAVLPPAVDDIELETDL